jgi:hypothetical protein
MCWLVRSIFVKSLKSIAKFEHVGTKQTNMNDTDDDAP